MNHLIIGLGEVGSALQEVLKCDGYDSKTMPLSELEGKNPDVLHICFPYVSGFHDYVKRYQDRFNPEYTVIHSTVPVGTCDALRAISSPIRGIHPHLADGIRTFVKYVGGAERGAEVIAKEFIRHGIKSVVIKDARASEAMKLWDTTQYGWNILIAKAIAAYCEREGISFEDVYALANATYNEGYTRLGHPEFTRPVLKNMPGPIGGHCVRQNWELLDDPISVFSKTIHQNLTGEL